jgi:hypothetical protein
MKRVEVKAEDFIIFCQMLGYSSPLLSWIDSDKELTESQKKVIELEAHELLRSARRTFTDKELEFYYNRLKDVEFTQVTTSTEDLPF